MESIKKWAREERCSDQIPTIAASGNTDGYFVAPFDGTLIGANFSGVDALVAHDSNYLTFSLTNVNNSNAPMLAATDVNTTKATGGAAIAANTKRDLTLNATPANLVVQAGQRIRFRAAASGTPANTITYPVVQLIFQRA